MLPKCCRQIIKFLSWKVLTHEETEANTTESCKYSKTVRTNTACCYTPVLAIWGYAHDQCRDKCSVGRPGPYDNPFTCCIFQCCLIASGQLVVVENDDGTSQVDVDWRAVVSSFLLSVGNDTQWTPIVNETVQRCFEQHGNTGEYICEGLIPINLPPIVNCSYSVLKNVNNVCHKSTVVAMEEILTKFPF